MSQKISVRIDGELCTATEGQTIFEVAARQRTSTFPPSATWKA